MPPCPKYQPNGVIPAILLPFKDDLSIDESPLRNHIRDVASTEGLSALTINGHSMEVSSCTLDEQRRVLEIAQQEVDDRLPLAHGV
jgi:4-hydroxy-tetrahydrodipicolinate synthase